MALKNLLVLSAFVQLAISAPEPFLNGPTRLSSRTLAQRNGNVPAADAGSTPQMKPTMEASGEAAPKAAAVADGPPAHEKAGDSAAPTTSPEGAAPAPKASTDASAPKAAAGTAPLVTTKKVANEVVNTDTTSTSIAPAANKGLAQKNIQGNSPTPAEAVPISTTVVTNKVSHEVLTTNPAADQSSASHPNPAEKAAAEAPKAGKTDSGSAAQSAAPAGAAPHESAHPPSAEKASPDAHASSSKEVEVSVKAPKQPEASPSAHGTAAGEGAKDSSAKSIDVTLSKPASPSAHETAAGEGAKDSTPKSIDVTLSKPAPASNSDGSHSSESSNPHKVGAEVSTSSTPAGPDDAAAKKVQVNIGKPAAAPDERSDPETSAHTSSAHGGSGPDPATGPAASTKPETQTLKTAGSVFHDSDDSAELPPADKQAKPNQTNAQNGGPSLNTTTARPGPDSHGGPGSSHASDRYPKAKRSLAAASTLAYLVTVIIA